MSNKISIKDITIDINSIFDIQGISLEDRNGMLSAGVLFIPNGYRDSPQAFASGTSEFYAFCRERMPGQVEICTTDESYIEVELNSCQLRINKTVVMSAVFNVFLNVLGNYITDWSKTYVMPQETQIEVLAPPSVIFSIAVIDSINGVSKQFDYDGPAADAPAVIKEIKSLWYERSNNNQPNK